MSSSGIVCGTGSWTGPRPGDPDNASVLSANGVYGGIDVSWTYPSTNSHAVAHVLLYRNSSSDRDSALNIAVVAGSSYFDKQDDPTLCFYWIRIVSINGTTGDWIGPVSAISKSRAEGIMEDLTGQINAGVLAVSLRQDIDKITLNYQDLLSEIRNRIAGDGALSLALEDLQAGVTQAMAFVHEEINTRIDGDNALAQQVSVIAALNANNASAIINEATARVTADEAHTYQMNALYAATNTNAAAVITETNARTNADSALAGQITTAQSTLGNQIASVQTGLQTNINTVDGKVTSIGALYTAKVSVNGLVGGFGIYNDGHTVEAGFDVDRFWIGRTATDKVLPFIIDAGTVYINKARIRNADIDTLKIAGNAVTVPAAITFNTTSPINRGGETVVATLSVDFGEVPPSKILITCYANWLTVAGPTGAAALGILVRHVGTGAQTTEASVYSAESTTATCSGILSSVGAGVQQFQVIAFRGTVGHDFLIGSGSLSVVGIKR